LETPPSPSPAFGASLSNLNHLFPEFANQVPVSSSTRANYIGLDTGTNVFAIHNALNGLSMGAESQAMPVSVPAKKKKAVRISSSLLPKEASGDYFGVPSTTTSPRRTKMRRNSRADADTPGCLDGF
jgi:hypothetical protein